MDRNMNGNTESNDSRNMDIPVPCNDCRQNLQEYLDGTLEKKSSLQVFMHLQDCDGCKIEHDQLEGMFQMLENLQDHDVPEGFDDKILASVNYEGYRAMENLRRERIPVFLEEEYLPAFIRSTVTRLAGAGISAASLAVMSLTSMPEYSGVLTVSLIVGLVPELIVRLQSLSRRTVVALQSES